MRGMDRIADHKLQKVRSVIRIPINFFCGFSSAIVQNIFQFFIDWIRIIPTDPRESECIVDRARFLMKDWIADHKFQTVFDPGVVIHRITKNLS